jgi:hypothetical protein
MLRRHPGARASSSFLAWTAILVWCRPLRRDCFAACASCPSITVWTAWLVASMVWLNAL